MVGKVIEADVSENVISPSAPTMGETGRSSIPDAMQAQNTLVNFPRIHPSKIDGMYQSDGEVAGLYRIITTPLRGARIRVHPKHQRGKREANFIHEIFHNAPHDGGMRTPLNLVMATINRQIIDGYSPHEIVWKIENGFIRIDKLSHRPINTINKIKVNNQIEIESYVQNTGPNALSGQEVVIPADKVLHFVFQPEFNPIFGRSMFTQAYYHYEKKHKLYYISHIAAQIRALRLRVLQGTEQDPDKVKEVLDMVAKLGFNSTINLPDGYTLTFPDVGSEGFDVLPLIQHHDAQMAKSILAQVLDVGVEGRTGSFNLSETHLDIFITNLELIAKGIAATINTTLIPKLIDWNFGTGNYPKIEFVPFDRDTKKSLARLFEKLAIAKNMNVTPQFRLQVEKQVAEDIGLDGIDYEAIEKSLEAMLEDNGVSVFEDKTVPVNNNNTEVVPSTTN